MDVSKQDDVAKAAETIDVDVLVNNAGVVTGKSFLDLSVDDVRRTVDTNVLAHFWVTRSVLPRMIRRGDACAIVSISSLMGQMAGTRLTDYCASKWAVNGFTEALRLELRAVAAERGTRPVHTMIVCPYVIDTGMFDGAFEGVDGAPWFMRRLGLFPKLKSAAVANDVVRALRDRRHLVVLPWYFRFVPPVLHLLPASLRDWIEEIAGARVGMTNFRGHDRTKRTKHA